MYKTASGFIQDSGIWSAGCGSRKKAASVVYFYKRNDNKGRERVFRFVKTFITKSRAEKFFGKSTMPCKALIYRGAVQRLIGDENLVRQWCETRRGVNQDIDPFLGSKFVERE